MNYVLALAGALILNAVANLSMKVGANAQSGGLMAGGIVGAVKTILTSPVLLGGLICFGLNAGLYMYALQSPRLKISIAYPIMVGGGFAIIALTAALLPSLRERLTPGQWVGVAMILTGVIIVAVLTPPEVKAAAPA